MAFIASKRKHFRNKKKWFLVSGVVLACLALLIGFLVSRYWGPTLPAEQKQWKEFSGDDPGNHSLKVVSHGYRMSRVYESKTSDATLVEWEWAINIQNRTNRRIDVYVSYTLIDQARLPVDVDVVIAKQEIPPGETVTVQHETEMNSADIGRVAAGAWELSWQEDMKSGRKAFRSKSKGF